MLPSTRTATFAIFRADPTIDAAELNRLKAAIDGKADNAGTPTARPLVKRSELKRLTGLSGVSIDRYARMGALHRVYLGGSSRATGFTPESVDAFLAGRTTANADGNQADEVKGGAA